MNARNTKTMVAGIKLGIFTLASILVTGLLAVIMGHFGLGGETSYHALFSSASMLKKGDDVRVAGVSVGQVSGVEIHDRSAAMVSFKVRNDVPVTTATRADVRFLNLVGDRYLALSEGEAGAPKLASDGTIPLGHTTPSLNLTDLFNGFQPLFQALSPHDVNELSLNLVRVLQGEGGTIQGLLSKTASLTNSLADRDQLIGDVVKNLSSLLGTVDDHHKELDSLVVQLRQWLGNLAKDRNVIGSSLQNISTLTADLADLLTQSRPYLKSDIVQLQRVMAILTKPKNKAVLDEALHRLPELFAKQVRIGSYGSWYNYYLCDFTGRIILPKFLNIPGLSAIQNQLNDLSFHSTAKRCS
jgi:phospholipid/cholesterol/gamma-HCH transport system substrate-binding protein